MGAEVVKPDYFRMPARSVSVIILVVVFYLLPASIMAPQLIPSIPGVTDRYLQFVSDYNVYYWFYFWIVVYIHSAEALVAVALCIRKNINLVTTMKWTLNVAVHGVFALKFLVSPPEEAKKDN